MPALPDWTKDETRDWAPPVDVEETEDAWVYELELPGVRRDDIQVELAPCELIVSGKVEERKRTGIMRHQDRHTGSFEYKASIPASVDPAGVDARFDNGVLAVRVPRPERARTRHVKIS
jgi:HSP20 family protein